MIEYFLFVLGIIILVKSAGWLVDGSSFLAKKIGVSSLFVGLTIVAFGTSLPEIVVTLFGSLKGSSGIVLGNIIGSNISNILLVGGFVAILSRAAVSRENVRITIPLSVLSAVILLWFGFDGVISFYEGLIMIILFFMFIFYSFFGARNGVFAARKIERSVTQEKKHKMYSVILMILFGVIGLYFGGKFVVDNAVVIANSLGFSEFLISATVIAIGTSLPELVTSVVSCLKKKYDIAIGNIAGSNIFNILLAGGLSSLIMPLKFLDIFRFDVIFLIISSLLFLMFLFIRKRDYLEKWEGIILVLMYLVYISVLIFRG